MNELPTRWAKASVGSLAEVILGQSPPGSSYNEAGVGLPFFQGKAEFGDLRPRIRKWTTDPRKIAETDDVLLSVRAPVGPTNLAPGKCVIGRGLAALRPLGGIDSRYVLHGMRATADALSARGTGTTFDAVGGSQVRAHLLPLAPLGEQRRIVAAIEEHFSRLDIAGQALFNAQRRLRILRSRVLSQVLEASWPHGRIGDVARVGSGATPRRGTEKYWVDGTIPWVTSGQLTKPYVRDPAALITEAALRETNVKLWPKHTLLVALYGEGKTRGHCSELLIEATTNQACAAIVVDDDAVDRSYLKLFFAASYDANRRLAAGGVQPNLSLGLIKNLRFPLPPLNEQHRTVAAVEQQLSIIEAMGQRIEAAERRSATLRRSMLDQAFSGKLVPEDPSDEPASVLLERIAAERAASASATGRRPRRRATMKAP